MNSANQLFRQLPKMDDLLNLDILKGSSLPSVLIKEALRRELDAVRSSVSAGELKEIPASEIIAEEALQEAEKAALSSLRPVVNGTGVILHTNLGRACLSERAARAVYDGARGYSSLEYDISAGERGSRHDHVESLLCRITGAEAAMVVNNNAAAVLLMLSALGKGGEVITSRGELVEIGGSFRVPEIMVQCGCTLKEVGTTNKTHSYDYESAIGENTRALLKVHTSNFKVVGFTESVSEKELVELGKKHSLPVIHDLGSGLLMNLQPFGIADEPTVQDSIRAGVDIVSFSGDKLLGGPQAGIILGKKEYISLLKKHPLARALRVDKMTLTALRETLFSYIDCECAVRDIPTLQMLSATPEQLRAKAEQLSILLKNNGISSDVLPTEEQVGGGSAPTQLLSGWAVAPACTLSPDVLDERLRRRTLPVIGRIYKDRYLLDVRTIKEEDFAAVAEGLADALK